MVIVSNTTVKRNARTEEGMNNKSKIEKYLDENEVPAFLRELADAIEHGGSAEYACTDDFKEFKIEGKNQYGKVVVRAKFKSVSECAPPPELLAEAGGAQAQLSYAALKNRMKLSFKMITGMVHQNLFPPNSAVDAFLADSAQMVTFSGYGDEYYDEFTRTCGELKAAYEAEDMDKLKATVIELAKQKGRCHAKYD